ncbi:hypothetical protein GCM10011374_31770 [Kocuria dechangensis]|uniref:SHSP domain-containing protein n=1 Tax=Kocuria dechangensis TaxID=1176249 RepID=A0A917LYJ9_9MICC|nr:Hsp20/alpha crystallin family protein [Kocuria dechangensis]GGG65540.1 hypothetical protein GCM10011374_31770 [Kocuria dechangensis]
MAGLMRRDVFEMPEPFRRLLEGDAETSWPRVEEYRDGDTLVVRAELPGIDPDKDVELTVANDMLHLRAERREKTEHKDKSGYRSEFRYGSFSRTVPLPKGCKDEDIAAAYRDGVLEVRVPVGEPPDQSASRKIPVSRG